MRKIVLIVVAAAVAIWLIMRATSPPPEVEMPEQVLRQLSTEQIVGWTHTPDRPVRLRTARDVIPSGFTAAMLPMIIGWEESDPFGENPYVVLRNLNYGGNPLEGTTVLRSVTVPLDGVIAAEFITVPLGKLGRRDPVSHGQLRFVFAEDNPMVLRDLAAGEVSSDATLTDLVLSWEAWRPPGVDFNVMTGMDPSNYQLSLRAYGGAQRFLEDALQKRDWYVYPLRLPGGSEGLSEMLKVSLALGDGVSRNTISRLLEEGEAGWLRSHPSTDETTAEELARWEVLREVVKPYRITDDPLINLPAGEQNYQSLIRSCATMALYCVNAAVHRLIEQGFDEGVQQDELLSPSLGGDEPWMTEIADADLFGVFLRAPAALRFIIRNPQTVPSQIPRYLEKAGLLVVKDGKAERIHYSLTGMTPYGDPSANLIR